MAQRRTAEKHHGLHGSQKHSPPLTNKAAGGERQQLEWQQQVQRHSAGWSWWRYGCLVAGRRGGRDLPSNSESGLVAFLG